MPSGVQGCEPCHCRTAAAANEAIRRYVAGRAVWTPEALTELDRLRRAWAEAVRREMAAAA